MDYDLVLYGAGAGGGHGRAASTHASIRAGVEDTGLYCGSLIRRSNVAVKVPDCCRRRARATPYYIIVHGIIVLRGLFVGSSTRGTFAGSSLFPGSYHIIPSGREDGYKQYKVTTDRSKINWSIIT